MNVTNLVIHLNKSLSKIANTYLFELNDETNRAGFINSANPILRSILSSGGISQYKIVCDGTNNTASVIANNEFIADVFIKPAKSIQTIQLRFTNALENQNISGAEGNQQNNTTTSY